MKEKIIEILKKHHLHHYGDFEEAVEELNEFFQAYKELNDLWKPQDEPFFFSQREIELMHKISEIEKNFKNEIHK